MAQRRLIHSSEALGENAMSIANAKQEALQVIQRLPDNVELEEIVYRLYVLNKIHQGLQDVEEGRWISNEDIRLEVEQW